ncbi:secretin N-terminal domain-containing protein [Nitrospirillum amazonense]|uniref:secretin N-terminal domain-containing protein n=1 Tax=Nitrospirillum amazonense TaxID=28077 RepID=UPI002DD43FE7|nr:secretin N-terminal domain-containing protein [Nitrospirillum amazonense]MEC4590285.1 secretin N-terminal domain-containing protein [Nitrospirillum amazonense]
MGVVRGWRSAARKGVSLLLSVALTACAGHSAYQDGVSLVAEGKMDDGLAKLQEAYRQDPRDVQVRTAYLQTRERALTTDVERADKLAAAGSYDEARALYRHALSLNANYERAQDGLAALEARARQAGWMNEADALLSRGQVDAASQKLARVLTEAPADPRAQALKHAIDTRLAASTPQARLAQVYHKPITIEFKDVSLKQVFEVIAHTSGLNFLFDKDVKTDQRTSIFLKNSTIEAAVRLVLLTNQLEQQVLDGNTVLIYPNTQAKQKDYQELSVRTFYLANAEAKTIANTLKTIIKVRDIAVDEKLNMVIVRDTPEAIRMAEKLVAVEDVPDPEVMLDVEVLEIQRSKLQNFGIQWPASASFQPSPLGSLTTGGDSSSSGSSAGSSGSASTSSAVSLYDLTHQTTRNIGVSVGSATANANLQDSDARLLTNPRIRVRNHEKAKILIGQRLPNITSTATSTGFLSQSVNYIDVGLTLNVEPTIYLDDNVGIKLTLEVSSIIRQVTTQTGTSAYEIGTRTASTALRLKNGETDVLAGLIDSQERTSGNKLPGLGDVPVLGRLFGATTDDDQKTEIVLSITPHLVRNLQRPDVNDAMFNAGTETSMHTALPGSGGGSVSTSSTVTTTVAPVSPMPPAAPNATGGTGSSSTTGGGTGAVNDLGLGLSQNGVGGTAGGAEEGAVGAVPGAGTAQLQLQGTNQAAVGGTVTVNLLAQATQGVTSFPVTLGFDAARLQVTNIAEGPFLKQSGASTSFSSRLGNGQVIIADSSTGGAGVTSQGVLATVTFKALATGSTNVQVASASPIGVDGVPITLLSPSPYTVQIAAK